MMDDSKLVKGNEGDDHKESGSDHQGHLTGKQGLGLVDTYPGHKVEANVAKGKD